MADRAVPVPESWSLTEGIDATRVVLDAVRLGGCRSRSELIERTGLSRAVVSQRVAELTRHGIVEAAPGPSTGGRPPRQLRFRQEAGTILAVDLGATSIDAALTDLAGKVIAHVSRDADISDGPEAILGAVETVLDDMVVAHAVTNLAGIGIGVPGPVEFEAGRPVSPPIMPGWDGYPIRERLQERYGAPVWVDNDVNVMAMGEWRTGIGRGHRNMVFVKVGTGIGAGLISDGVLHRGAQGAAGDVGHIQVGDDRGITCRCGNVGCLEALAGGQAIGRDAELVARAGRSAVLAAILERDGALTARTVAEAARRGDPASLDLIQRAGRLVGGMLAGIVNFFNPSLIVVGGGVAESGDSLLAAIRETVYRRSLPLATRDLRIVRSELAGLAGISGAAAIVADELFSRDLLATTIARTSARSAAGAVRNPTTDDGPGLSAGLPGDVRPTGRGPAAVEETIP